ncbi:VWA domain-containing protein [Aeromicrobium sp. UC242_57]|uniref:VWA domain-containing protein n=1 Tax=Aeromicrobium sp. UC242_57 TaxID=3374624 RepID=UPI0037B8D23E
MVDPEVARRVRRIAARLSVPRARRDVIARRGTGAVRSVRYRGGSDDIDLEATVARLVGRPIPEDDDIIVRERMSSRRSVVLAVDVSGSMNGERATTAAATVGALFAELSADHVAVVAFWSDASLLVPLGQPSSPQRVLDMLLRLPSRGLTNVSSP